jgi:hypothetical protein
VFIQFIDRRRGRAQEKCNTLQRLPPRDCDGHAVCHVKISRSSSEFRGFRRRRKRAVRGRNAVSPHQINQSCRYECRITFKHSNRGDSVRKW